MANYILKNNIDILRCNNWAMEAFFNNLKELIDAEGLEKNEILINFLERLDQDNYGRGCVYAEITNYFNGSPNKLPIRLLYDLTLKTIERIKQKGFQEDYIILLDEFSRKIL